MPLYKSDKTNGPRHALINLTNRVHAYSQGDGLDLNLMNTHNTVDVNYLQACYAE